MARAKSEFKQQKNIPIKNKKIKKNKIVKPQKIKSNPKKFVKLATESMQSQVKAAAGNRGKKSLGVKRKQQDVDNGVKKFKNNKDQAILRVHNSNNNIQKEVKDSSLKLIKSSGSLKQDNLKIQSLDAKKKSVVKMGKVETSEQNTDIKKMDIKSSHCSEKIPSAQQATGCRKGKNEILKQKLENAKQEPTQPNPSKQKTVAGSSKDNFTQLDNAEKIFLVQKVRSRRRKKQAMSQIVTQLSTVKHGFPNNKNSSEELKNMKPTQPQPKLKEKSVQKSKNVKEIVVDPISDTYFFGSLKVKQGGIHKKDKLDDCLENLKKQKYLNIVQEPIQQTINSLKKKSDTSLHANQQQNEQFNCEKIPKENRDMENSKRSKPQNLAQEPIKPEASEKSQSGLFPKIFPVKQVQIGKQDKKTKEKQVNFSEELKSILQKQMINIAEQKKTEEDKQNILKEIQDNLEKKSRGSKPESIAQKSIKEKDSDSSQSGLKKKKKHDKCEKISKGSKPENKALKSIKRKKAEASQTELIEEIVTEKQVQIQKQDQDSCEKKSEDKPVHFSEEFKSISQKQVQQMINNVGQKNTEEDKQSILNEIQDNLEKKSRGSKPESIAQKSIKEKDSERSQSGLKKKEKHDKCEKISKGSKPEYNALKPIKKKKAEATQIGLIEEIVPVKQVLFEKQNQGSCKKKSKDKRDNFKENLKKAKFENIEQEPIQQSINNQKKNSLTLQDIIQNQSKENNNHKMLKENQDTYMKISKGSKPEHKALKPIKMKKAEASLTWFIEEIVPEKQVLFEKQNQDTCGKKSEDKQVNFSKKFKSISQKQVQQMINNVGQKNTEEDKQNILNEIQDNLEKKSRGSKSESIAQKSIKEKDSERSQSGLKKKEKHDKCEKISKGSKRVNKALKPIKRRKAEASLIGLIEEIVPVKQEKQNQDCCEKKSEDKQDSFKENLKEAKFENIEQETIQQSINDQKKNSLTLQSQKEENNHKMLKKNRDTYVKISKVSKPENKALKPIKMKKAEASLTWFIEDIVPVKQAQFQKHDQDSCEKKSEEKQVNFSEKFKSISQKQIQQEDKQNILREIQDNLEKKSGGSKPESIAHKSIKEKDSDRSQSGLKKKEKHDKSEKISKRSKPENEALKPIKRKTAEASLTGLIEEIVPVKQAQFQNQDQDSCEKNSEDKQVNFSEKLKNISQKQMINNVGQKNTEEDKQNILREIQGNLEKKSRGSKSESIAQSGLKKKEKHDKCVKISEGSKPENEALKPIKRKTAETSLTGLIEEIVSVKQVQFHKQDQDSCENNSEDKQVNFSEKFKRISQKQIQQMINNAELKKTEEDEQNILKEIQDNLEKKSRGSKSESIAQKALSTKEKDSDRAQSGLKKKEKLDKCEKISKGSKPKNKALKTGKTEEASLTKLIEEVVPEKQVLFEKQNQDSCEKKSEDKRDNFKENLKEAKFENIEQETIHQSINDQKKNSLTLQNQKEENNHKMLKENRDTYVKISKGSKPGNTNLKPIKKRTAAEASLTGLIEKIVPVKQVRIQNWDQENGKNKSKEKYENITQELINKTTNGKQEEVQYDLIGRIVPIKPVAICKEINCETNLKQSKPENTTLHQNCVNNIKPEESFKAQISKSPLNQVYDDQSKQINCSEKIIEKSAQKLNEQVNITQEMRVETSGSGLIGHILPVMQVVIDEEENKRDSCTKNLKRKREPIEMQAVQLENNVQKVKSVESEGKKLKISNLVKPTQLVAPGKVTICQSDTRITSRNCDNNILPLQQENSEQNQLHASMDEMLNERWRKMKAKVEKSENKIRSQFMRCTEYVLTNEGTVELTEEPMQTKKADEISQTSLIGKLKSLLKRRLTCHF